MDNRRIFLTTISTLMLAASTLSAQGTSAWVFFGPDHRLQ